jgi:2-polyprenyl-3-methyl-5-hydroxy-6-metoxy-1,4-benzoquinol methylase/ketosteroid isomerase-like protein
MGSANLDVARSICAAWERGDFGSVDWADADLEYVIADGLSPGSWRGRDGPAAGFRDFLRAWEGLRFEVDEYHELADGRVLVLHRLSGRGKTSGVDMGQFWTKGAHVFELRGGKVGRLILYFDRETALADLSPAVGPAEEPASVETSAPEEEHLTHRYVLGHAARELERLQVQGRLIEPITRGFFVDAGIVTGMRVLDVGSGVGDVAFLVADLVGETGEVVGVDRSATALALARQRAAAHPGRNVSFEEGDPSEMVFERPFDAVVGRYVLMFQPDPAAMLRSAAAHVQAGGVVAFHEPEWACARSHPPVPSWDRCCELVVAAMSAKGADMQMGMKLPATFAAAGLPAPSLRYVSVIGAGANCSDQVHFTTDVAVTVLADIEELGLAALGEIDPGTLADRVTADVAARGSVIVGRSEIGAWSRNE